MFKIVEQRRAWWPVTFAGVTEDGDVVENRIELQFELLSVDDNLKLLQSAAEMGKAAEDADDVRLSAVMADYLMKFVRNWRHVAAENGDPLPFTPENLALLMNVPNVFDAAMRGYRECITGAAETRAGN